ncbi:MAG: trypsin-like peptidase domain-containing protein [bacterium]|nr:trypsin-like peptidase domain-containing protein [bacterium]
MNFKAVLCALFLLIIVGTAAAQQPQPFDLAQIERATVFIMQARQTAGAPVITCVGSGTLVTRNGLILTNAHHTVPNENCPGDLLIVSLSVRPGEAPTPLFQAEIVQADPGLDLALIRISRQNDGRLIDTSALALPFVEIADSDTVQLDNTITVVGYPGIGNEPVTAQRGTVVGFTAEPSGGNRSWIKTELAIPGVMSGGGVYNQEGQLIGIPTTAPAARTTGESNCLILQDTNSDGQANTNDACVPVGGVINALRPSNFASALLRAASLGLNLDFLTAPLSTAAAQANAAPTFERLFFAPAVNEAGMPTATVRSMPSGSTSLYLFFDYSGMTPETVYEVRVAIDGVLNPTFGLSPVRWSGGRSGSWYVGTTEQPLPNGVYDFTLYIDGVVSENARLLVGQAEPAPSFSDIVFGVEDVLGNIAGNGFVLPVAATVSARFIYRNMTDTTNWAAIWFREGAEIPGSRVEEIWSFGTEGTRTIRIQSPSGLLPGTYRLDLYIDSRLAATSNLTLAGAQDGRFARIFNDSHFTTASSPEEAQTAAAISSFTAGTAALYAVFDWELLAPGTLWTVSWYVDDELFFEQTIPWSAAESGQNFLMRLTGREGIPDGTYRFELKLNNLLFGAASARVGIGQLPIDRFAAAEGVLMRGQIMDALTGTGIPGASVFIVSEDFSAADFTSLWLQEQLFASAVTDSAGFFEIDRLLAVEVPYSIVIVADGYLPITADGLEVTLDDHPIDIQLYLTRG